MQTSPLKHWALMSPDCLALITPKQNYTWSQLYQQVEQYTQALARQEVCAQSVVTCIGKNSPELLMIYLACAQIGTTCAITMPQPKSTLDDKLATLYGDQRQSKVWLAEEGNESANLTLQLDLAIESANQRTVYDPQALASIIFTSGSMSKPKAVVHTHAQHLASAQGLLSQFHFNSQDTWLLSLPMYHVSGLAIVYRWLFAGAILKVGSGDLLQDIQNVTHASLVAVQLERLLSSPISLSLSHVLLGGGHVPLALSQQAAAQGIETWLGYGMTEAASTVTAKRIDAVYSAGSVLPKRQLELREGRIFIGGETLASGYFYQGQLTPITDDQGWFDSKDLGEWLKDDGLKNDELVIKGRVDNQFISGGENIHCEEIEQALNTHPAIMQSIVVAIADEQFGARPVAVIQAEYTLSDEELSHWLTSRLVRFKHPKYYLVMPEVLLGGGIKIARSEVKRWLGVSTNFEVI